MRIKMLEMFQSTTETGRLLVEGITVKIFEKDDVLEVDDALGMQLIADHKAVETKPAPYYGAQPQPELRHDDIKYEEIHDGLEEVKPKKRGRK